MTLLGRHTVRTMCPMNCHPTLCGMLVDVEDGRLIGVRGDKDNPDSRGFLCMRGQASREIIDNSRRLLRPMVRARRSSDEWRETSWDEALDLIAARMRAAGGEAVGMWTGHGLAATNYGTRLSGHLVRRFANLWGCQSWSGTMICWGLGAFGLGLTGILETNTKEDMSAHAELIVLWGANLASQPNTARHVAAARRRGAYIVTIDVRQTEAASQSDETLLVRPGTDAALALALMHVIVAERLWDRDFVARHTTGFDELAEHVATHTPAWASGITGVPADVIVALGRRYATTRPAMIVIGGSSMHKGDGSWTGARAIGCLPALTGNVGIAGGGFGPRHGSAAHGQGLTSITAEERRPDGAWIPSQMPAVTEAMLDGRLRVMLLLGTNMLSSYADAGQVAEGLARQDLVVAYDLFMNDTARRCADVVLPATAWLEELGCKSTNTHLYLMPKVLDAPGQARPVVWVLRELARRLEVDDFFPWTEESGPLDAILDHPATNHATVASISAEGGIHALNVSPIGHPDLKFPTPSGKVELLSELAGTLGLPALPVHEASGTSRYPLVLSYGRTLTHFHAFYDHGRALPSLAQADPEPALWISPADATARGVSDGGPIRIVNDRGAMTARAHVTERVPAGTVWMRDGWLGINDLSGGAPAIPDAAVQALQPLGFSGGQATFDARVEVEAV
ncbi:MAG TPA: molybdopterin-dependent oxidoreductase [Methylomirabilota bacterium]|jgi:anaerobic selenocysteine-containing dehydrogenase|nr:molybdopterin-dependent oxidoreductase [Methylomirabilota bacterium]